MKASLCAVRRVAHDRTKQERNRKDLWTPFPGPQTDAYESQADEVFYGGSAGCGKSSLLVGLALTAHFRSLILRREYPQLKGILEYTRSVVGSHGTYNGTEKVFRLPGGQTVEFGSVPHEHNKERFQGRPHDALLLDEISHFTRSMYQFLMGWLRTEDPEQHCRIVCTGNPPTTVEGRWVVEEWAPWLDPKFPNPAEPGELRWYLPEEGRNRWLESPDPVEVRGRQLVPRSRTFIPGKVTDNPVYMASGYDLTLDALPEPLRSMLRDGDFQAGIQDDAWQVIPTAWVEAAQARWTDTPPDEPVSAFGLDPARGGVCKTLLSRRHGAWFAHLVKVTGAGTPDSNAVVKVVEGELLRLDLLVDEPEEGVPLHRPEIRVDVIGIGSAVHDALVRLGHHSRAINAAAGTKVRDKHRRLKMRNWRAYCYWNLRDLLDPANGEDIALPPDRELLADLCAARWEHTPGGVLIEAKEKIAERLGRSPDCADAVVLCALPPRPRLMMEEY